MLEILRETEGIDVRTGYEILRSGGLPAYRAMLDSEDAREGARAFAESRRPGRWAGGEGVPLATGGRTVPAEWIDYNGHMMDA